jgi:hypothetical protein
MRPGSLAVLLLAAAWIGCGARTNLTGQKRAVVDAASPKDATEPPDATAAQDDSGAATCTPGDSPLELASDVEAPSAQLGMGADAVYYSSTGGLSRVAKLGGTSVLLATVNAIVEGIGVDGLVLGTEGVYFGNGDVEEVGLDGGASVRLAPNFAASSFALDPGYVYAATFGFPNVPGHEAVVRVPRAGGTATSLVGDAYVVANRSIAVDDVHLFVSEVTGPSGVGAGVTRFDKDGTHPLPLGPDDGDAATVAIDDTYVYWTAGSGVRRANKLTGATTLIVANMSNAEGIAVDAEHVYWGTNIGLFRANKDGAGVVLLVREGDGGQPPGFGQVGSIGLDATCVYWTVSGEPSTLWRAPK